MLCVRVQIFEYADFTLEATFFGNFFNFKIIRFARYVMEAIIRVHRTECDALAFERRARQRGKICGEMSNVIGSEFGKNSHLWICQVV